ncbi:mandelate racemase/muconate lactonizing enzyme family protein [Candidatus Latescibacterota bacterium]
MKLNSNNRRSFLKSAGIGSFAAMGTGMIPSATLSAINNAEPMKITKIEAVRFRPDLRVEDRVINWTWVLIHTNTGIVGIGETYPYADGEIGMLKTLSSRIIGKDPRDIEKLWWETYLYAAFRVSGGAEMRMISAINIALWDILGKALGVPVYRLLGGKVQQGIRIYNTTPNRLQVNNMNADDNIEGICRFLLSKGIKALKLVVYDNAGIRNNGAYITPVEAKQHLELIKRIRDSVGYEMEVGFEFHSRWNLPSAIRIAKSLEPYNPMFIEDILMPDNAQSYAVLARETSIPLMVSERNSTRYDYRELLEAKAVDLVMWDVTWCGGITSAKKISDLADTYYIPVVAHTNGGPILWVSSIQTLTSIRNVHVSESVYQSYNSVYQYFITNVPVPDKNGLVTPPEAPGLGVELREEPFKKGEAIIETIAEI